MVGRLRTKTARPGEPEASLRSFSRELGAVMCAAAMRLGAVVVFLFRGLENMVRACRWHYVLGL